MLASGELDRLQQLVEEIRPERLGVTGAGGSGLSARLASPPIAVNEFAAWGRGAGRLLRQQGRTPTEPFLLVSLGTGTSVMLCDGATVSRVGGTALGGGTVLGLGSLLLGEGTFSRIADLAGRGDRRRVDLLVGDIYQPGEIALLGDATASAFGKRRIREEAPRAEDLAHAIMGLVGENVALLCTALAAAQQTRRIVFGGTTLRANAPLRDILLATTAAFGGDPVHLEQGEFAGALGALALACEDTG